MSITNFSDALDYVYGGKSIQQVATAVKTPQTDPRTIVITDSASLLTQLGLSPIEAVLATVMLSTRPSVSDSAQGGVGSLVKACQMTLQRKGYPVVPSGKIDDATAAALHIVAGQTWQNQTWQSVCKAVLGALQYSTVEAFAADHTPEGRNPTSKNLPLIIGAVAIGAFLLFNKKGR